MPIGTYSTDPAGGGQIVDPNIINDGGRDPSGEPNNRSASVKPAKGTGQQTYTAEDNLLNQIISPDYVNTQVSAQQINPANLNVDPSKLMIDTAMFDKPVKTHAASGGQRLDFEINPMDIMSKAMEAFQSQLGALNVDFADQSEQLAKGTSALGRAGSGLFNRDTGFLSDRARATREALLGNLSFDAAKQMAAESLQGQMTTQQLLNAQEGRFSQASMANAAARNAAEQANRAQLMQTMLANQGMGFNAMMGNQQVGLQAALANQGQDFATQMANIQNQINQNQFGANFAAGQQQFQANQQQAAQNNLYNQLGLMYNGFQGNPASIIGAGGQGAYDLANLYGGNAAQTNQALQQAAAAGATQGTNYWDALINAGTDIYTTMNPATPQVGDINQQPTAPQVDPNFWNNQMWKELY